MTSHTGSFHLVVAVASHRKAVVAVDSGTLVVARVAVAAPSCYSVADLDIVAAAAFDYYCCCTYCSAVDRSLLAACRQAVVALAAAAGPADCIGCGTGCIAAVAAWFYFESYSESKDYSCDSSSDRLVKAEESCPSLYWEEREKYVRSTMFRASAKQAVIIATGLPFFVRKIKQK